ncbi:MAG: hypothetical protein HY403_08030 [Elusimicrobia bacterium]|nr:hypothetical protein [Elusimicrobiota bacterium]
MYPKRAVLVLILGAFSVLGAGRASAHCDGFDGPVVTAARKALETSDVGRVLIWVQPKDAVEIKAAFQMTLAVRKLGAQAKELADRSFFETLVRVHRAGEGAPFTGLKPAGRDLGPAIPAADKALASGALEPLRELLTRDVQSRLERHFKEVLDTKEFKPTDAAAGRKHVRAYVEFVHFVELVHQAAAMPAHGHFDAEAGSRPSGGHED